MASLLVGKDKKFQWTRKKQSTLAEGSDRFESDTESQSPVELTPVGNRIDVGTNPDAR
jgi:hypothetical protein